MTSGSFPDAIWDNVITSFRLPGSVQSVTLVTHSPMFQAVRRARDIRRLPGLGAVRVDLIGTRSTSKDARVVESSQRSSVGSSEGELRAVISDDYPDGYGKDPVQAQVDHPDRSARRNRYRSVSR